MTTQTPTPRTRAWQDADWIRCGNDNDYLRCLLAYGHCSELEAELAAAEKTLAKIRDLTHLSDGERFNFDKFYELLGFECSEPEKAAISEGEKK